mgnify:CR=1 FL=1
MKIWILAVMALAVLLVGCVKQQNQPYQQELGCSVAVTHLQIENITSENQTNVCIKTTYFLNKSEQQDFVIPPSNELAIFKGINRQTGECEGIMNTAQLPCSYCIKINKDFIITDEGTRCLSGEEYDAAISVGNR